jgi:hypothetical protein
VGGKIDIWLTSSGNQRHGGVDTDVVASTKKDKMMASIIYYVASSMDGFIAGQNDDISDFAVSGKGVDKYLADLQTFKTVIRLIENSEVG